MMHCNKNPPPPPPSVDTHVSTSSPGRVQQKFTAHSVPHGPQTPSQTRTFNALALTEKKTTNLNSSLLHLGVASVGGVYVVKTQIFHLFLSYNLILNWTTSFFSQAFQMAFDECHLVDVWEEKIILAEVWNPWERSFYKKKKKDNR